MLNRWLTNTKRVLTKDVKTGQLYEFENVFPDGAPDGTAFSAGEMNKVIDTINILSNPNLLADGHFKIWHQEVDTFSKTITVDGRYIPTVWFLKSTVANAAEATETPDGMKLTWLHPCVVTVIYRMDERDSAKLVGKKVTESICVNGLVTTKTYTFVQKKDTVLFTFDKPAETTLTVNWVKLEEGEYATPIENQLYSDALSKTQYYYTQSTTRFVHGSKDKSNALGIGFGTDALIVLGLDFPVRMRIAPSLNIINLDHDFEDRVTNLRTGLDVDLGNLSFTADENRVNHISGSSHNITDGSLYGFGWTAEARIF